jgi:hypothetical protein
MKQTICVLMVLMLAVIGFADRWGGSSSNGEILIASWNAPAFQKSAAKYQCTGTNDYIIINQAIDDAASNVYDIATNRKGATVLFSGGVFNIGAGSINPRACVAMKGSPCIWATTLLQTTANPAIYYRMGPAEYGPLDIQDITVRNEAAGWGMYVDGTAFTIADASIANQTISITGDYRKQFAVGISFAIVGGGNAATGYTVTQVQYTGGNTVVTVDGTPAIDTDGSGGTIGPATLFDSYLRRILFMSNNTGLGGVYISKDWSLRFEACLIEYYAGPGLKIDESDSMRMTDCYIAYNYGNGVDIKANHLTITGSEFNQNGTHGTTYDTTNGIYMSAQRSVITNCTFRNNAGSAINTLKSGYSLSDNAISNCISYGDAIGTAYFTPISSTGVFQLGPNSSLSTILSNVSVYGATSGLPTYYTAFAITGDNFKLSNCFATQVKTGVLVWDTGCENNVVDLHIGAGVTTPCTDNSQGRTQYTLKPRQVTVTANTTIYYTDNGSTFINTGDTDAQVDTLQTAYPGLVYFFVDSVNTADADLSIDCQSGDHFVKPDGTAMANGEQYQSVSDVTSYLTARCYIPNVWQIENEKGTWTEESP